MTEIENINNEEILLKVEYNIEAEEEDTAFDEFQRIFVRKKNIIKTVAFLVALALFIDQIVRKPDFYLGWLAASICVALIFITWYNPIRIKKYIINAFEYIKNDRYVLSLYKNRFTIETILPPHEENEEINEEYEEEKIKPEEFNLNDYRISILDREDMYVLFFEKRTLFVIPKRCLNEDEKNILSKKFSDALKDRYLTEN